MRCLAFFVVSMLVLVGFISAAPVFRPQLPPKKLPTSWAEFNPPGTNFVSVTSTNTPTK